MSEEIIKVILILPTKLIIKMENSVCRTCSSHLSREFSADKRPRNAIEVAKEYLKNPTKRKLRFSSIYS